MRKFISVLLALLLVLSLTTVAFSAYNVVDPVGRVVDDATADADEYQIVYFQMPNGETGPVGAESGEKAGSWYNEYNELDGQHYAGIYWWAGAYTPKATSNEEQDWPGYRAVLVDAEQSIFSARVPLDAPMIIWNNGVDGGEDKTAPVYTKAAQTVNVNAQGCADLEDEDFGNVWSLPEGSPDYDNSYDGCIYIVDPDQITINDYSGAPTCGGDWYVYYGNGCYGYYPTTSDNFVSAEENCVNPDHHHGEEPATEAPTEEPAADAVYVVAGSSAALFGNTWDGTYAANTMTKNSDGTYSITYTAAAAESVQLKVVKDGADWLGDANGDNVAFEVTGAGDFTVTIDPADNNKITVTGDNIKFASGLEVEKVIAVGNSAKTTFLNGIDWGVDNEANAMTEIADGVYEISYKDVAVDAGMQFKLAVNGTWDTNFGIAKENAPEVVSGTAFDAAWDGANIALPFTGDEEDNYDITLKLDMTGFDFATKSGAKITATWAVAGTVVPTEAPTDAPVAEAAYYVVGNFTNWSVDEAYKLSLNEAADVEEYFINIDLDTDGQFKIVKVEGEAQTWLPDGMGNNYGQNGEITADGNYDVYFRPNADGGDGWFYNVIFVELKSANVPTEAPTDEPNPEEIKGRTYYLTGSIADWGLVAKYEFIEVEKGLYKVEGVALTTDDSFKAVRSTKKGDGISTYHPDGVENDRKVTENGIYTIYFRPAGDGTEEDGFTDYIPFIGDGTGLEAHGATVGGYMFKVEKTGEYPSTGDTYKLGDANGDNTVDITDATVLQRHDVKMKVYDANGDELSDEILAQGDVDGDGLNIIDVTWIQRYDAKMDVPYAIGEDVTK